MKKFYNPEARLVLALMFLNAFKILFKIIQPGSNLNVRNTRRHVWGSSIYQVGGRHCQFDNLVLDGQVQVPCTLNNKL